MDYSHRRQAFSIGLQNIREQSKWSSPVSQSAVDIVDSPEIMHVCCISGPRVALIIPRLTRLLELTFRAGILLYGR
jgi:hypothetical protein